ncbi:PLDc N-terminal domain-containing protein [Microbacterium sp. cx-55]|uniref:PLDc N-terminal domain-containing protein n=1 Tax=Microbacterium sp. cx-55 TaxID=2875948 RepID=UPI001CBFCDE5|nr:PLDc N-terminal domain-containing protein [Microbacterium sp. cx-55]MBZ4486441.1 PLDc N-terminal domain-containing protein [Microbacterium sp. cx-55]UGB36586.1 PLDc N-terminal domain-containing protein [Microbacterium sp. cx-55]
MSVSVNPLLPDGNDIAWALVTAALLTLMLAALVSLARHATRLTGGQTLGWTLLTVLVPIIGPITWLAIGRRNAATRPDVT